MKTITEEIVPGQFRAVPEEDEFFSLWPNRYDYICAERPKSPGDRPKWRTERRHPITARLFQQGHYLIGVRPGRKVSYLLLDIDAGSRYHPSQSPGAIARLQEALEPLGLVESIICTSSYSKGVHIYFPFEGEQKSIELAEVVSLVLHNAGFQIMAGELETFPNPKLYSDGTPTLFNAHRLPLQEPGSQLLNRQLEPIITISERNEFIRQWKQAQSRNSVEEESLEEIKKRLKRRGYRRLSSKAEKFLNDLEAEIAPGWSGAGQTNYLLGRIAMKEYIFHHMLSGGNPLRGEELAEAIAERAKSLPGYGEHCRHQREIEKRSAEWGRSIEKSQQYYPYGSRRKSKASPRESASEMSWNEKQAKGARERIQKALADLLERGELPSGITARRKAIAAYGISQSTLSKTKEMWHPEHLRAAAEELHTPAPSEPKREKPEAGAGEGLQPGGAISLCTSIEASSSPEVLQSNALLTGGSGGISTGQKEDSTMVQLGLEFVRGIVEGIKQKVTRQRSVLPSREIPGEEYFAQGKGVSASGQSNPRQEKTVDVELGGWDGSSQEKGLLDLSEVLVEIDGLAVKKGWSVGELKQYISEQFGGKSRSQLTDEELVELLRRMTGGNSSSEMGLREGDWVEVVEGEPGLEEDEGRIGQVRKLPQESSVQWGKVWVLLEGDSLARYLKITQLKRLDEPRE